MTSLNVYTFNVRGTAVGTLEVRSWYARGTLEVRYKYGTGAVRVRYGCGTVL